MLWAVRQVLIEVLVANEAGGGWLFGDLSSRILLLYVLSLCILLLVNHGRLGVGLPTVVDNSSVTIASAIG